MTTKKPTLLIRLDERVKAALRKSALADQRSMAVKAQLYIEEGLRRDGFAPEAPKKKTHT